MDLTTILFVNIILSLLGLAILLAFQRLDRIVKRKLRKRIAGHKNTTTHAKR